MGITGVRRSVAAVLVAMCLVSAACSDDAAPVATADDTSSDATSDPAAPALGRVPDPLVIDPPPEGFTLDYAARNDPDDVEEAVVVYGRPGLDDPFDGPLVIHSWLPGEVVPGPWHQPVDLGGVEGYVLDESDQLGPTLALTVQWQVDGDRHEVMGLDVDLDDLIAVASAASTGDEPPDVWDPVLRATQPDGFTVSYSDGAFGPERAGLALYALRGDSAILGLLRAMESRGMCSRFDQAVCGDRIDLRGGEGFLISYDLANAPDQRSEVGDGEVHTVLWLEPSGWVVSLRAGGVSLDQVLAAAEQVTSLSWDEFDDLARRVDEERFAPVG